MPLARLGRDRDEVAGRVDLLRHAYGFLTPVTVTAVGDADALTVSDATLELISQ